MRSARWAFGAVVLGAGYGTVTSFVNDVSSQYGVLGSRIADTGWAPALKVVSQLLDVGWSWAALAVAAGWLVRTRTRGAFAGALALIAATAGYFGLDSVLRAEPFVHVELVVWWIASVILGPPLGAIGASMRRPGVVGLLAALTVPVGASVQMIWLPPQTGGQVVSTTTRVIVWATAAVAAAVVLTRFLSVQRRQRASRESESAPFRPREPTL
jgi:hypothetical protein